MTDRLARFWQKHKLKIIGFSLIVFFVLLSVRSENTREKVVRIEREGSSPTYVLGGSDNKRVQVQINKLIKVNDTLRIQVRGLEARVDDINTVGTQGPTGQTGRRGPQGLDGGRGASGTAGQQGPQGLQGERGERGPVGAPGAAAKSPSLSDVVDALGDQLDAIVGQRITDLLDQLGLTSK